MSCIQSFYEAFQKRDFETMQNCYAPDAMFEDPAFGPLSTKQTKAMWHMLCKRATDLKITFEILSESETQAKAKWIAEYTYATEGTFVHNEINATFELKDGKIFRHKDEFSIWKWSRQALGLTGWYLGWTPILRKTIRRSVLSALSKFIEKNPMYME
jgi:ketosteroid isomerase-like protein